MNLQIIVEGRCEDSFVKRLLAPHLAELEIYVRPIPVHTSSVQRGGMTSFARAKADIQDALNRDGFVSTMFDLFRLPRDFPGMDSQQRRLENQLLHLENALKEEIADWRFIPYLQAHEFEALLFSSPTVLDTTICTSLENCPSRVTDLEQIVLEFESPEHINGRPETAPSKRLERLYRGFSKTNHGVPAAQKIGLPSIRQKCGHFHQWVQQLEAIKTR